jgi:Zn-dependent alcohol dehydrogenase
MNRRISQFLGVVLAVSATSAAAALPTEHDQRDVAIVVAAGPGADGLATVAAAREIATARRAQFRVTRTTADQLGVTHMLAAQRYDEVLTIGLDRRSAIDPVAERYPHTRFVELSTGAR